jgi:hypothetical protein
LLPLTVWLSRHYLSVDFPEHDIERADDSRDVSQHVPAT